MEGFAHPKVVLMNALAILACCALMPCRDNEIRIFSFHMDNGLERPWSVWDGEAIRQAKPAQWLRPWVGAIEAFFIPLPSRQSQKPADIAIALFDGKRWLFVDRLGAASLGGNAGRFDVVGYERLLRRLPHPVIDRIGWDPLITFRIRNCSNKVVEVRDSTGKTVLKTGAGIAEATTWFCPHHIFIGGNEAAETDNAVRELVHPKQPRLSLTVWQRQREPERSLNPVGTWDTSIPDSADRYTAELSVDCDSTPTETFPLRAGDFAVRITESQESIGRVGGQPTWWGADPQKEKIIAISDMTVSFKGKNLIVPRSLYADLANPDDFAVDSKSGNLVITILGGAVIWGRSLRTLEGEYKATIEISPDNRIVRVVSRNDSEYGGVERTEFQPGKGK